MRRLVYAPKVWIFIRSSNEDGKIYDVSSDVVRGSVTQNLGDLSTAEFELRNRFYKWVRARNNDNRQIFLPMDLVTIWMQRIAGRPVQVFTGYLDEVPYYQGYPANAIFKASCTLKKLAFNWFDPGLPTWFNWLSAQGWQVNPETGEALANVGSASKPNNVPLTASSASFADLLGRFMVDVAGWATNDVIIGTLPASIGKQAAKLMTKIEDEEQQTLKDAGDFLGQLYGVSGAPGIQSAVDAMAAGLPPSALPIIQQVHAMAADANLPDFLLVFAALALSNFNPNYKNDNGSDPTWGYGLYALRPNGGPQTTQLGPTVDGVTLTNILSPTQATRVMARRLNQSRGTVGNSVVTAALKGDAPSMVTWVQAAAEHAVHLEAGVFGRKSKVTAADLVKQAQTATGTQLNTQGQAVPLVTADAAHTPLTSDLVKKYTTDAEKQVIAGSYGDAIAEMGAALLLVKGVSINLVISDKEKHTGANQFYITGSEAGLGQLWAFYQGRQEYSRVDYRDGNRQLVLQGGVQSSQKNVLSKDSKGILVTVDATAFDKLGKISVQINKADDGTDPSMFQEGGLTLKQLAAFSASSAFAAQFAFPADTIESRWLTGEKALMNDVSCLDGVKQLCAASLRTFRSLPDGRFLAFYPDYFGSQGGRDGTGRDPYWKIYNIEIQDFGIQLNDDALATHVYVIGDSLGAFGASNDVLNEVVSRGVATITQELILESFMVPPDINVVTPAGKVPGEGFKLLEATAFLEHYGNRPHKENQPLIRNSYYEFAMAWQRFMQLWSQQFATSVTFTFQPEVMAGGIIEFPDHYLQMFCESVTHNWDYESGFSTNATLTAPAIPKQWQNAKVKEQLPGFALGGSINTVGLAS